MLLIGTNDSNLGLPGPSGLGCTQNCEGTYKHYVQSIVNAVTSAGKSIVVARIIPILGTGGGAIDFNDPAVQLRNSFIQEYNQVIETELSNISVGPDLFGLFLDGTSQRSDLYAEGVHPNALGVRLIGSELSNYFSPGSDSVWTLSGLDPLVFKQNLHEVGDTFYLDRDYRLLQFPSYLDDGLWIETANDQRDSTQSNWLSFDVGAQPADVYVAYDANATQLPTRMSDTFSVTGDTIAVDHVNAPVLSLFVMTGVTGTVNLGGNLEGELPTGIANYIAIVTR